METKIGILGLGGVGGYFGGLLAKAYKNDTRVRISFIARPATSSIIQKSGLRLITPESEEVVYPAVVSSNSSTIGHLDVIIVAVKSYDLEEAILSIKDCISEKTIILPLLNGVGAKDIIEQFYPDNLVLDGCVFVISKILEKGVIEQKAGKGILFFGSSKKDARLEYLHELFLGAGIKAKYAPNIQEVIWGKYLFISTLASITSYLDITTGELIENETYLGLFKKLLDEFKAVADAHSIHLSDTIKEDTIRKVKGLPYATTTSMQRDFQQGRRTEYLALTKYIVDLGEQVGIPTETYKIVLLALEAKSNRSKK